MAKVLKLQLYISPFSEYSGLISFRIDWFNLLAVQRTLKSLLQHHSSKASIPWRSAFLGSESLLSSHIHTWLLEKTWFWLYGKWKWSHSVVSDFAIPWTVVYQASLSMGFSRQEYWSGLPFPSPGGLPDPAIEPKSSALQADTLPSEPPGKPKTLFI